MTAYTNPHTGRSEQITDSRALATKEERIAAAAAEQAAFEQQEYLHYEPYVGWWLIRQRGNSRFLPGASSLLSDAVAQRLRESGMEIR